MAATEIMILDLRRVQVAVGQDENKQPTIVITDGTVEIVFGGGEDRDVVAGSRRIVDGIWDYHLLVTARREAAYRVERLEGQHGITEAGGEVVEPTPADAAARLAAMGPRVGNSGAL